MEDVVMNIEDLSQVRPAALPDCIVIPRAAESCREPSENTPPGGAQVEEYLPMPSPLPTWPRVFPGL
jgi:hypothetical protein